MAKARAIVKRRKAVRNIRKITKTMQMIATAKFQKSLKRAVGTKPYTLKVRELVSELAGNIARAQQERGAYLHPLLLRPGHALPGMEDAPKLAGRVAVLVIASNRGLAGAYNGNVLRKATAALREQDAAGNAVDLYVSGKKAVGYFIFQRRPIARRVEVSDPPRFAEVQPLGEHLMRRFVDREIDAVHVVYMNFISTGVQKPDVLTLLPLIGLKESMEHLSQQVAEKEAQMKAGMLDARRSGADVKGEAYEAQGERGETVYDFYPEPKVLLDELLPLTVNSALYQAFLDGSTSEHDARMVSMKSATDNADKMVKALTMKYNRARQSQITTELSEIMGGVEAMKK